MFRDVIAVLGFKTFELGLPRLCFNFPIEFTGFCEIECFVM
jgi:hypothetical protein